MSKKKTKHSEFSLTLRDVAVSKFNPVKFSEWKRYRGQTFGAASEVRKIDPKEWKAKT